MIDSGQFTFIGFIALIFLLAFAVSASWAGRNWWRLILAFISALAVAGFMYVVLTIMIMMSSVP